MFRFLKKLFHKSVFNRPIDHVLQCEKKSLHYISPTKMAKSCKFQKNIFVKVFTRTFFNLISSLKFDYREICSHYNSPSKIAKSSIFECKNLKKFLVVACGLELATSRGQPKVRKSCTSEVAYKNDAIYAVSNKKSHQIKLNH